MTDEISRIYHNEIRHGPYYAITSLPNKHFVLVDRDRLTYGGKITTIDCIANYTVM